MMLMRYLLILILPFIVQDQTLAEVYKYKDKNGRWHYTDSPPAGNKAVQKTSYQNQSEEAVFKDYQQILQEKYSPKSTIETATLAVVTIETVLGTGSGFFVSENCHIVTNRHVVRPTETGTWQETDEELKEENRLMKESKQNLLEEQDRLTRHKRSLSKRRDFINGLRPSGYKNEEEKEYQQYLTIYKRDMKQREEDVKILKDKEKRLGKKLSEFSLDSSMANVARSFDVILKDSSKTKADLLHLNKDQDLALLKIDNCKSPYLTVGNSDQLAQGMKIFSIGSPLGQRDHVTAGVITNLQENSIVIDAQILPGNSGGPLINPEGEFLGVNTLKLSREDPNSEGFGITIPAKMVMQMTAKFIHSEEHKQENTKEQSQINSVINQ